MTQSPAVKLAMEALRIAKEKLQFYRDQHSGEYVGGVEFTVLMKTIATAYAALVEDTKEKE